MNELFVIALEELAKRPHSVSPGQVDQNKIFLINRTISRILLGILSGWIIFASIVVWFFIPGVQKSIITVALLAYFVLGIYSLFLTVRNKPGNIWGVALVTPLALIVAIAIFVVMLNVNFIIVSEFVFFVYFFGVFTPIFMGPLAFYVTQLDPLPISSHFLRIAYPVRFKHLKGLHKFATGFGWKIYGLIGLSHKAKIVGEWNGHEVEIVSGREYGKRPNKNNREKRNYVVISMKFQYIPWKLSAGKSNDLIRSNKNDATLKSTSIKVHLSPPNNNIKTDEWSGQELYASIEESAWLLQETLSLYTTENVLVYQTKNINMFVDQHNIQTILNWMDKILRVMETNGLTEEEFID